MQEKTSPGPLAPGHAGVHELSGSDGCERCHGTAELSLDQACLTCHEVVGTHLIEQTGLHGSFEHELQSACGTCHVEHHGAQIPLVGALAFERAGIAELEAFEHGHVPFALTGAHERLACEDCHPSAQADPSTSGTLRYADSSQCCASCHEDPHQGRYREDCARCHGQEAPFAELASFVHSGDLPLVGAHAGVGCEDCHAPESERSIEVLAGGEGALGARACGDCHDSPHRGTFLEQIAAEGQAPVAASCALCHDASHPNFSEGASLSAAQHAASGFALTRPHGELECAACHTEAPADGGDFAARHPGRAADTCDACHVDAHGGQFARGPFADATCTTCHEPTAFRPHAFSAALHGRSAFPLGPAHAPVPCADCHAAPERPAQVLRFDEAPTGCDDCHEDAHAGGIVGASEVDCAECHRATRFDDVARADFDHDGRTRFALEGAHDRIDCEACHVPAREPDASGRVFGRSAAALAGSEEGAGCAACHEDVHGGAFDRGAPAQRPARFEGRQGCARCHTANSFRELRDVRFEHELWTGFALDGAHDAIACQACHGSAPEGSARTLGLVREHYGREVSECADCHRDVHAGAFDLPGRPRRFANEQGCARCHGSVAFDLGARDGFDHGLWTDFSLEGAHTLAACADCHVQERSDQRLGAVRGARCNDCHADPHVGQFAAPGGTDCAACHGSAGSFTDLSFDHERQSRFLLDEQHVQLDCVACHRPWPLPGGGEAVRYKPLGVLCSDCHASEDGGGLR